jgi:di/tricarboxylate transporter
VTLQQGVLFALITLIFAVLIWGRIRYDLAAFGALVLAFLSGVIPEDQMFSGFGHPAVVIIALVLSISTGLTRTGAIDLLARQVIKSGRSLAAHIAIMATIAAALSTIMNNVAALAMLMPLDVQTARKAKRSPAMTLMPLSFASILGGMVTLIGTPPNIVIATFREGALGEPYAMYDYAPEGLVEAVVGHHYVSLDDWRQLPADRGRHDNARDQGEQKA